MYKFKKKLNLLFLLILFLPFVSAVELYPSTILNTSSSNTSITFDVLVSCQIVSVEANNITLTSCNWTTGASSCSLSQTLFSSINSNQFSSNFECNLIKTSLKGFCSSSTSGYSSFFVGLVAVFGILAIAILIFILIGIVTIVQGGELNMNFMEDVFDNFPVQIVFAAILFIVIIVWASLVILGALCS